MNTIRPLVLTTVMVMILSLTLASKAPAIVYQQWDYHNAGPQHCFNDLAGAGVDSLGNVYIACFYNPRYGTDREKICAMKFDPDGHLLWASFYEHAMPIDAVVDQRGNLYITGMSYDYVNGQDYLTLKFNSAGQILWHATYSQSGQSDDEPVAIALDGAGNVYVTGTTRESYPAFTDYATVKYNAQGVQQWVALYDDSVHEEDVPCDLALDQDGNVYVTGFSLMDGADISIFATVKYNSQGAQQWVALYDDPISSHDWPEALTVDAQRNVYITGFSIINPFNARITTVKYNASGVQEWVNVYDNPNPEFDENGKNIITDGEGNVIVVGNSSAWELITLKYHANGTLLWLRIHPGGTVPYLGSVPTDYMGLVVDADNNIYIAGCMASSPYMIWSVDDCLILKYTSQGNLQWSATYGLWDCDEWGTHVALDHNDNVIVAGNFNWPDLPFHYHPILIKYHEPAGVLTATMIPAITPIVIPAQGGSFSYDLQTFNTVQNNLAVDFWWKAIFPNPAHTQQIGPESLVLPLNSSSYPRTQNVPGNAPAGQYQYILYAGDYPNLIWATDTIQVTKLGTGIREQGTDVWSLVAGEESLPLKRGAGGDLFTASPNPFNPTTVISYQLSAFSHVSLNIYDVTGRMIANPLNGWQEAGSHQVIFDGSERPSGLYFVRMQVGEFSAVKKVMLVK
jgi:hypothetical protein